MSEPNSIEKMVKTGELEVFAALSKLSFFLERAIALQEENRQIAIDHKDALESQLERIKESGFEMSEDGKLEAEITKTVKIIADSSNSLRGPISAITAILSTQIKADAFKKQFFPPGGKPVSGPVDISEYEPEQDYERDG